MMATRDIAVVLPPQQKIERPCKKWKIKGLAVNTTQAIVI